MLNDKIIDDLQEQMSNIDLDSFKEIEDLIETIKSFIKAKSVIDKIKDQFILKRFDTKLKIQTTEENSFIIDFSRFTYRDYCKELVSRNRKKSILFNDDTKKFYIYPSLGYREVISSIEEY